MSSFRVKIYLAIFVFLLACTSSDTIDRTYTAQHQMPTHQLRHHHHRIQHKVHTNYEKTEWSIVASTAKPQPVLHSGNTMRFSLHSHSNKNSPLNANSVDWNQAYLDENLDSYYNYNDNEANDYSLNDYDYDRNVPYNTRIEEQAEKGRSTRETSKTHQYPNDAGHGVITAEKIQEVGSVQAAQKTFASNFYNKEKQQDIERAEQQISQNELSQHRIDGKKLIQLVREHKNRIEKEGKCSEPRPELHYPEHHLHRYWPRATILHRCSIRSGCCDINEKCVVKDWEYVYLAFETRSIDKKRTYEIIPKLNHTKCHCVSITNDCNCPKEFKSTTNVSGTMRPLSLSDDNDDIATYNQMNTYCNCDCDKNNRNCHKLKNGIELFSSEDHNCIIQHKCALPTCSHGYYNFITGSCPQRSSS